jgi:hypothetical protein
MLRLSKEVEDGKEIDMSFNVACNKNNVEIFYVRQETSC